MIRAGLALALVLAAAAAGEDPLPRAPAAVAELHGTFAGARFWARLTLPKAEFGGHRVLELVYSPPAPTDLGGAHLPDCPYLLLDDRLRLVAWNGRDTLARAVYARTGYQVVREVEGATEDGKDRVPRADERAITAPPGWDERLAPVLLALAWRHGSAGTVPCVDLFGPPAAASAVTWRDETATIAGRSHRIRGDAAGRLAELTDASGATVLAVTAWIAPPP